MNFDFLELLNVQIESQLSKNAAVQPLLKVLCKYGIRGFKAIEFLAEFATAAQSITDKEKDGE